MKKLLSLYIFIPFFSGCMYGFVYDAQTGNGLASANIAIVNGSCSGAGCGSAPYTEQTTSTGEYVFDAYGNINGAANVKIVFQSSGQEAVTIQISKPGYRTRYVYHKGDYEKVNDFSGNSYYVTDVDPVYLCAIGSLDSDGDSLCDDAEAHYGTDPNNTDTDGDNLSDAAELFGTNGVDLTYYGSDPLHKNFLIEADYYPGLKPSQAAIDQVTAAFADAPVSNPDGTSGIILTIDLNQQISAADVDNNLSPVWSDFDVIKNTYFNSRRSKLFHYALFANQYNGGSSSGISRGIPAHDFVVSLGTWSTSGGTVAQQAGTLMHEFGHNIGLMHGGNQNANRKLNYISVMSYNYQMQGLNVNGTSGVLDYSRLKINSIGNTINEFNAFSGYGGTSEATLAQYGVRDISGWLTGTASSNLDVDRDGVIELSASTSSASASPNDWDNITFAGGGGGSIGDSLLGLGSGLSSSSPNMLVSEYMMESCMTPDDL